MSAVSVGAVVRLVRIRGVASDSMRRCLSKVGTVGRVRDFTGRTEAQVTFALLGQPETFWLAESEFVVVDQPPAAEPEPAIEPPRQKKESTPVADFQTAVQKRIDQLAEEDAALEAQVQEAQARRAVLGKERKALEAAVAAYNRARGGGASIAQRALPAPRTHAAHGAASPGAAAALLARLRVWAAAHDGLVVVAQFVEAVVEEGIAADLKKAHDNFSYVRTSGQVQLESVERGVWRLLPESEARSA